jgi:hypothetical protein
MHSFHDQEPRVLKIGNPWLGCTGWMGWMGWILLAGGLAGAVVEKKVRPLLVVAPYAWIGGRLGKAIGCADEVDCNWTGLGE